MKTGLITIVVLSLTGHSLTYGAYGGAPGGAQCVANCLFPGDADAGLAQSEFQLIAQRSPASEDPRCQERAKMLTCIERCQVHKYVVLARKVSRIWEKYCGFYADEAARETFFVDSQEFLKAWLSEQEKCQRETATDAEICEQASTCDLGSALTTAKTGFRSDVVSVEVNWYKIGFGVAVDGKNLPSSCEVIFQPYQRHSYQRTSYQRNPYQRNPYQRNFYQNNPYQRGY